MKTNRFEMYLEMAQKTKPDKSILAQKIAKTAGLDENEKNISKLTKELDNIVDLCSEKISDTLGNSKPKNTKEAIDNIVSDVLGNNTPKILLNTPRGDSEDVSSLILKYVRTFV